MRTIVIIAGIVAATGCTQKAGEQQFIDYINNPRHNITQQLKVGDVQTTVKWVPDEYQELKNRKSADSSETLTNNAGFYFFDVRFDKVKGDKPEKEKQMYLNFDMHNDFILLMGNDSVMPVFCQKIENGISGSYQYLLAFEKDEIINGSDFTLIYKDKIFGTGTQAFVYRKKDMQRIPKLKSKMG